MYYSILSLLEETLYSDYRCDYGSVNAIQRLGWFSVNLSFKFSSVPDDIIADKRDLVVHRKLHRKS